MRFQWSHVVVCAGALGAAGCAGDGAETVAPDDAASAMRRPPPPSAGSFTAFESGQVRPLAISADRRWLYATNTPDNRVEVFRIAGRRLVPVASVPVGLEPVALAEHGGELWVVNHLSDSVSVVDVTVPQRAHVVRTLLVGDEPRDIVFAGPGRGRAFITTAHRGQNTGRDPQLTTPGVGRADVWVFDAARLGASLGGTPLTVITLFADTPRALAVAPDGATVYAAGFESGNRTTVINERLVRGHGGLPPPFTSADGTAAPPNGLIVRQRVDPADGQLHWLDPIGRRWDDDHPAPAEGPDDDAEPARPGQPRADALARRSHRRHRRDLAGRAAQRAARHRDVRRAGRVPEVQRRVHRAARPRRAADRRPDAGVHRLHAAGRVSAQSDPQPRQLAHPRPAGGPRLHLRPHPGRPGPGVGRRVQLQRVPRPGSPGQCRVPRRPAGVLRDRRQVLVRHPVPVLQGPAPAQHVSEGGDVRDGRHGRARRPARGPRVPSRALQRHRLPAGDQVRGFGFLHDGSVDTLFRFHAANVFSRADFNPGGFPIITHPDDPAQARAELTANVTLRRQVEAFMMAFDTNLAPIVGQQVTLTGDSGPDAEARSRCSRRAPPPASAIWWSTG